MKKIIIPGIIRYALPAILIMIDIDVAAQKMDEDQWEIAAQVSAEKSSLKDGKYSAAIYSGTLPGVQLSVKFKNDPVLREFNTHYTQGDLHLLNKERETLKQQYLTADYLQLYNMVKRSGSPWKCLLGGSISLLYSKRTYDGFINDAASFDLSASLCAAAEVSYSLSNGLKGFTFSNRCMASLISVWQQSLFGEEGAAGKFAVPPDHLRLVNYLTMRKDLSGRHHMALVYGWNYYKTDNEYEVRSATHALSLMYSYSF